MKKRKLLALLMAAVLLLPSTASAATLTELEQEQNELKTKINSLEQEKENIEDLIPALDEEINKITKQLYNEQKKLDNIEEEIKINEKKLTRQEKKKAAQYKALKIRIKEMYENENINMISIFFDADALAEILNSSYYISKISKFDKELLENYLNTIKEIENLTIQLKKDKQIQQEVIETLQNKQNELEYVLNEKYNQIENLGYDIDLLYNNYLENNSEIEAMKYEIALANQRKVEQIASQNTTYKENITNIPKQKEKQEEEEYYTQNDSNTYIEVEEEPSVTYNNESFIYPCDGYISSGYGPRSAPTAGASTWHLGLDFAAAAGSNIYAVKSGTVITSSYHYARGYYIVVDHGNGLSTLYQHCSSIYASVGQYVNQGEVIAAVGSTGYSTGAHCHFEVLIHGENVNPSNYL